MPFLTVNGFQLNYEKFPGAYDHNVLFIHGNLASNEWWFPSIEVMKSQASSKKGTILSADWRGYGKSKGITDISQIDFTRFAQDNLTLLEDQSLRDVNVVGHSTGGLIAMMAMIKRPELFRSLILLDSVGPTGLELELPKEQVLEHFGQMSINKDYCRQVLAATIEGCDPNSSTFNNLFNITWNCDKPMWKGVIDVLADQIDIRDDMDKIKAPTLILHGEKDMVLSLKMAETNKEFIKNSRLEILEGCGHSPNMENPKLFVEKAQGFWNSI